MATSQTITNLKDRSPKIKAIALLELSERAIFFYLRRKIDRPSDIRVNLRPSAVKKDRSPFLTIQKGDRPYFAFNSQIIVSSANYC
ncbi:MAG: hypothetical protein JGK24_17535 [Microcoleus sp. PH2017_29_MFU_D_A]|uniref:hypothetical protein n=1 Tax=unclassified Microcoleus TaxID=2642155 RepID=UPI001D5B1CB0|nr:MULTISPECIES: hypothetical protein [unclassified Microcoleus]MCC3604971.1 hypothetical protein [Microcoleus sp. PH2017_29_MFU_D_A]MCC3635933.1 hypothetical protein [Microcoleus sp. PH2017_37_MFU_D_B]